MGIRTEFVKEQKRYSISELMDTFSLNEDEAEKFIDNLKAFGILKTVKLDKDQTELSDLLDKDIVIVDTSISDKSECYYVFSYVGIVMMGNRIIKCYPKYVHKLDNLEIGFKQVLKVLEKYNSKKQIINLYNGNDQNITFNLFAVILFFLNDYFEHGIYNNVETITELNGEGNILWNKTVDESFIYLSKNRPVYLEYFTNRVIDEEQSFIRKIHKAILSESFFFLKEASLIQLFDLPEIDLPDETLEDLGDNDYLLYRLESELSQEFNSRKQLLLKTMYAYILHTHVLKENDSISMYGTNSFSLVWEDVCQSVFNNMLHIRLGELELPVSLGEQYKVDDKLIDIIEKPNWIGRNSGIDEFVKVAAETLIPDIITIEKKENRWNFLILDAKYYNLQLEEDKPLRGNPGIGDVTKQYLYQLAYQKFVKDHGFNTVKNAFLMPIQEKVECCKGRVKLEIFNSFGLDDIEILLLSAEGLYSYYLLNQNISISETY